jgi:hypothetical protein
MNRFRVLAVGTVLAVAVTLFAQPGSGGAGSSEAESSHRASQTNAVDQHLKILTEKLGLTEDQQAKTKPILEEMHDGMVKVSHDESLSQDERMQQMKPLHEKADREIRAFLTDDQKKKLDDLESHPHPELHEKMNGVTPK